MSFLKIRDPIKRNQTVEEYLDLKKKIFGIIYSVREPENNNYKLIFQSFIDQKATVREITEGLKPIKEGIENLPQAITFPPMLPIGKEEEEEEEEEEDF